MNITAIDLTNETVVRKSVCLLIEGSNQCINVGCSECKYDYSVAEYELGYDEILSTFSTLICGSDVTTPDVEYDLSPYGATVDRDFQLVNAVKYVKDATGWDLKKAKDYVDNWREEYE